MITEEVFSPVDPGLAEQLGEPDGPVHKYIFRSSDVYHEQGGFPAIEDYQAVVIGVPEYRGSGSELKGGFKSVRKHLYSLRGNSHTLKVADLGDIIPGKTLQDTYHLLAGIIEELVSENIVPVIAGGSQDLTYAVYMAYVKLKKVINIVNIDSMFDLGEPGEQFGSGSWLGQIIMKQPNYLFNYSNLGYQSYFVGNESIELMNKMYFECYRLGQVRQDITEMEPVIRGGDIISVDLRSVRQADSPASTHPSPNGFAGEEICQASRYAGLSDRVAVFGLFELAPWEDGAGQSGHLMAQAMWYFIDGLSLRKNEFPGKDRDKFTSYRVPINGKAEELVFLKNTGTGRWWIEVPTEGKNTRFSRHHYLPCSINDYNQACNNEVPERWWQSIQKLY